MMTSAPTHQPSDARLWPALGQHSPRLLQVNRSARNRTANPVQLRPLCSPARYPHPSRHAKRLGGALIQPHPA
jgi:hypothetical protein